MEALAASRGWATNDSNAWLTLRAETADGGRYWMGSWLPNFGGAGGSPVLLHVAYGDLDGEAASLAIWEDGKLLAEQVPAAQAGRWSVAVNLAPGALLVAVAGQADGDYAVTAPLQVLRPAEGGDDAAEEGGKKPVGLSHRRRAHHLRPTRRMAVSLRPSRRLSLRTARRAGHQVRWRRPSWRGLKQTWNFRPW